MRKKTEPRVKPKPKSEPQLPPNQTRPFHVNFKNAAQEAALECYKNNDILFLTGPAGTAKTFLATAFAVHDILTKNKQKMVITRPAVSDEDLGFLPGDMMDKVGPYMRPIYDSIATVCGKLSKDRDIINASLEVCPISFIQGRSFNDSIFVLDEAQNCTYGQLKLALSRLGINSKMIITGDPAQSFLDGPVALESIISKLSGMSGIGFVRFTEKHVVRHPLVGKMLKVL